MGQLSYDYYRRMPYDERCRQIGAILAKAAIRLLAEEDRLKAKAQNTPQSENQVVLSSLVSDQTEKRILEYLSLAIDASPVELCAALKIPRPTIFRKLARLRTAGLVMVEGKTQGARYRLRGATSEN